ncbi:Hypothetical predicted protein [Octopus vulgaris]|uniref:Uncharacterized protein n=1 Tax=Octopus vulgaris TaxID=6645 RepID=A0AA36BGD1_OCTVU|nr:Hypothetical predicted protein [Octopus vulgaris]
MEIGKPTAFWDSFSDHTLENIQHIIYKFAAAARCIGLTISIEMIELLYQPHSGNNLEILPCVFVEGNTLKTVDAFTYLGSIVTSDAKLDREVQNGIGKARTAFGKIHDRL